MPSWFTVANLTLAAALTSAAAAVTSLVLTWRSKWSEEAPDISFKRSGRTHGTPTIEVSIRNPSRRTMKFHGIAVEKPLEFKLGDGRKVSRIPYSKFIGPLEELGLNLDIVIPEEWEPGEVSLCLEIAAAPDGKPKPYRTRQAIER